MSVRGQIPNTDDEGTLVWYVETTPGKIVEFNAPFSKTVFTNKTCISHKELEVLKFTVLSRFHHLIRCLNGYYEMLISVGDQLGIALFGMAHTDPLQYIKFEYDNFSGYERLSVPYVSYSKNLPNTVAKISATQIKIADFFTGPVGSRGSSKDIQRLFTGLCKAENVLSRQKFMQAREIDNFQNCDEKPRRFLSWVGYVGNKMYREYRIDANLSYAPALEAFTSDEELIEVCKLVVEKRIREVPHYKQEYDWIMKDLLGTKASRICSMAVSSYMLLLQFEQTNFASNYEWTKPKMLNKFCFVPEYFRVVECKLKELSDTHYVENKTVDNEVEKQANRIRQCVETMKESVNSLLTYTNLIINYCSTKKNSSRLLTNPLQKALNGLYYAISLAQYCENLIEEYETVPIHLLTLIFHCLNPDIPFDNFENKFICMFNFDSMWENSDLKIAIATNFFELARRNSVNKNIPKEHRILYRHIYQCIPKLGSTIWTHTECIYAEISDEQIIENSRVD